MRDHHVFLPRISMGYFLMEIFSLLMFLFFLFLESWNFLIMYQCLMSLHHKHDNSTTLPPTHHPTTGRDICKTNDPYQIHKAEDSTSSTLSRKFGHFFLRKISRCGYLLGLPHRGHSNKYLQQMSFYRYKKKLS